MHDIEPHYLWRDRYIAADDDRSPFFGQQYDEFRFTKKIYNYFIHPQWDEFGSATLYLKVIYSDYEEGFCIMELIGEWNDAISNDVMYLKREVVDALTEEGINKFILICENVLNFHGSDDCYYEEWYEDIKDDRGWICFINTLTHVNEEMKDTQLDSFVNFGTSFNNINWRKHKPKNVFHAIQALLDGEIKRLEEI